jgi:hypothetical protein
MVAAILAVLAISGEYGTGMIHTSFTGTTAQRYGGPVGGTARPYSGDYLLDGRLDDGQVDQPGCAGTLGDQRGPPRPGSGH